MIAPTDAFYPDSSGSAFVIYDLRDTKAWKRAHRERAVWGRSRTPIHTLDRDHVVLEFRPGGALDTVSS